MKYIQDLLYISKLCTALNGFKKIASVTTQNDPII